MYCQKCGTKMIESAKFCNACGTPVGGTGAVFEPVSNGLRIADFILDRIGMYIFAFIFALIFGLFGCAETTGGLVVLVLIFLLGYHVFFETLWQRTPGKWITKTKVVCEDGTKPRFPRILGRTLCRWIPFDVFSFLFSPNPLGWHDRISHTLVVPISYTEQDVKNIDLAKLKKDNGSKVLIIIAIVLGAIAVLGIIASIVLVGLGSASQKAKEAKIQTQFSSVVVRAQAYNTAHHSFAGVCTDLSGIGSLLQKTDSPGSLDTYVCNDSNDHFAGSAKVGFGKYLCVDDTTNHFDVGRQLKSGETSCAGLPTQKDLQDASDNYKD
jgi:uncharacterized RDD family membrane protein YckC